MEVFLVFNGDEIRATVDAQAQVMLQVAAGELDREEFTTWLHAHMAAKS